MPKLLKITGKGKTISAKLYDEMNTWMLEKDDLENFILELKKIYPKMEVIR